MGPYFGFLIYLVIVPFIFGQLFALSPDFNLYYILPLVCVPFVLFLVKFAFDERNRTKDLWRDRLQTCSKSRRTIDLSVVVPAYNEERRLPKMLDEALDFLEDRATSKSAAADIYGPTKFSYEIIIVDDGSRDATTSCGLLYQKKFGYKKIRVITLQKNKGKGGAVRTGVLAARGRYVMFADADGASKFSDVQKLETFMVQNKTSDLVLAVGSRAHMEKEATASRSVFRTVLMKGFHFLVWTLCVRTIRDTQCGFKMFNYAAAELLFASYHNESWAFDVELLYLAEQTKCKMGEIAVNWTEIEGSKIVPVLSWIRMGWDVLSIAIFYNLGIYKVPNTAIIRSLQKH